MTNQKPSSFAKVLNVIGVITSAFIAYYLMARLGYLLANINNQVSSVWPAAGVALAFIYIFGPLAVPGLFAGALLAIHQTGLDFVPNVAISAGNVLGAALTYALYQYLYKRNNLYGTYSKTVLSVFSVIVASVFSSSFGTLTLYLVEIVPTNYIFENWITWWVGDLIGALFSVPVLFTLTRADWKKFVDIRHYWKLALPTLVVTFYVNYFVFETLPGRPWLFLLFVPLLFTTVTLGAAWTFILGSSSAIWATWSTIQSRGPFAGHVLNENFVHLQLFLLGLTATVIGLTNLKEEGLPYRSRVALLFGWFLSGLTFFSFFNSNIETNRTRFQMKTEQAEGAIQNEISKYENLLESGVRFFNASNFVTQQEWSSFTENSRQLHELKHNSALGVAFPILNENLTEKLVVTYLQPLEENLELIGLDLSKNEIIKKAAQQARDFGYPVASDTVTWNIDGKSTSAFLLIAPVYSNQLPHRTIEERKEALSAFVFTPISIDSFFTNSISKYENEIHLRAYFGSNEIKEKLVYSTHLPPVDEENRLFHSVQISGQPLTLVWNRTNGFESTANLLFSLISFFGAIISLLLTIFLSSLENLATTAQRLADQKTRETLEKERSWKTLTEISPVGVYITDNDGNCTYVNSAWMRLTGLSFNEALGEGWLSALHEEDRKTVFENWNNLLKTGIFDCNYRFKHSDGTVVHVSGRAVPMYNEKGLVSGYIGTVQDISELVKNQNALVASSRMSSLGEMASGVAHEINNPLAIILGRISLLEAMIDNDQVIKEKAKSNITQIADTIQRISKIIRGLKSFARETSAEPYEKSYVKNILIETIDLCRERFSTNGIQLTVPQNIDPQLSFWGRPEQIGQVLLNLLNNAFDVAQESKDKWVRIEIETIQKRIFIKVIDSGSGISEQCLEKMFEPFFTTKEVGKGTGLGLSISKGIIDRHNGRLYVDTKAPHTTFVVELDQYIPSHIRPSRVYSEMTH